MHFPLSIIFHQQMIGGRRGGRKQPKIIYVRNKMHTWY